MAELIVLLFIALLSASLVCMAHSGRRTVLDEPPTLDVQNHQGDGSPST